MSWKLNGRCSPRQVARRSRSPVARSAGRSRRSARGRGYSSSTRAHLGDDRRAPRAGRRCRSAMQLMRTGPARPAVRVRRVVAELLVLDQHARARRRGSRRRRGRARSAARRASPRRTAGLRQFRSGCSLQERVVVVLAGRRVPVPRPLPPKLLSQLFGGPPPGRGSRQMYQSRFGLSREARLSRNQGCWSEVWFGTKSRMTLQPAPVRLGDAAGRSPPACRRAGRCRSSRRRRSRSRPSARDRSARARSHRRRARAGSRAAAMMPAQVADAVAVGVLERARDRSGRSPPCFHQSSAILNLQRLLLPTRRRGSTFTGNGHARP